MGKNISNKYCQKLLHSAVKSTMDATKFFSEIAIHKAADATGDLIADKIADKKTNASKKSLARSKYHDANSKIEAPKKEIHFSINKTTSY